MAWIQLKIEVLPDQIEVIEDSMLLEGAQAVTLQDGADQPILEPELGTMPVWDKTIVIGLFDAEIKGDVLIANMKELFAADPSMQGKRFPEHKLELVEDKDWERAWMDNFHAMPFGDRLWVCPSWKEPEDKDAVNLMLDPGLAFGTGTHPTTAHCLRFLDQNVEGGELIIDYGCGSGILGIAALLLGSDRMLGVDNDPQALLATRQNAERNGLSAERYDVVLPENTHKIEADIMVANILAGPLISLAENIAKLTKSGGKLALSGLLSHQADEVRQAYEPWFNMDGMEQMDDWIILTGTKL
ncbi:MAG: 50S ribosomal protein L11 methyltransferase [Oleispira antarctica]|uniref:Ribosomal protein L11 methyltransferase n=1 Tax=Oleispira antarctica RB-8 TaxID=698738 RepID=R4YK90_OLEAN|nr:50S ribosomal protein L11 methyltransferase [Oleispira antarctica]MBQ0793792.1 50S ribosomal protein L11 methyltransferase [Oleispira antarctica]CCK74787.1 Ribosomal protein L11 methyltransferase [Oleispira antarctica RB-8]